MRTFYIFCINKEFKILDNEEPFHLYKYLEDIYYLNKKDIYLAFRMFENIAVPFDIFSLNKYIFNLHKDNMFYTKINNVHIINNYYTDKENKIILYKSHLYINSNEDIPIFLNNLKHLNRLFICDFINKDYFWLDDII